MHKQGCLTDEAVVSFVERRLPAAEVETTEQHLKECAACGSLVAEFAKFALRQRAGAPGPTKTTGNADDHPLCQVG